MACDERERTPFDGPRHGGGQALARGDRRVPLMERPRDESFGDGVDRTHGNASRKQDPEICLTSRGITEDTRVCQRALVTSPLRPCNRTLRALAAARGTGMSRTQQRV